MIVNRNHAEQALAALALAKVPDDVQDHEVATAFKAAAFAAHPDHGGTTEAFAGIDRAKHVLLQWIKQRNDAPEQRGLSACQTCNGSGIFKTQRGFGKALRRACPSCRGTGEANYEHDNKSGGT